MEKMLRFLEDSEVGQEGLGQSSSSPSSVSSLGSLTSNGQTSVEDSTEEHHTHWGVQRGGYASALAIKT
jgi:hypothetical protein